jgi:prephenate dehydratase
MKRIINLNKKSIGISTFTKSLPQFNLSARNFNSKKLEGCDLNSSLKYVKDEIKKSNNGIRQFSTVQSKQVKDSTSRRVAIITEINDTPGSLLEVLKFFWKYNIQLTHIESRPNQQNDGGFNMYIDFEGKLGDENTDKLMEDLR